MHIGTGKTFQTGNQCLEMQNFISGFNPNVQKA